MTGFSRPLKRLAAAPDLLEACKAAMADINTGLPPDGRTIDALTAAIAKATD